MKKVIELVDEDIDDRFALRGSIGEVIVLPLLNERVDSRFDCFH